MTTASFTETYKLRKIERFTGDVEFECLRGDEDGDYFALAAVTIPIEAWESMGEPMVVEVVVTAEMPEEPAHAG